MEGIGSIELIANTEKFKGFEAVNEDTSREIKRNTVNNNQWIEYAKSWQIGAKNDFKALEVEIGGFTVDVINSEPEAWPQKLKNLAMEAAAYGVGLENLTVIRQAIQRNGSKEKQRQVQDLKNTNDQEDPAGFPGININLPDLKIPGFHAFPRKKNAIKGLDRIAGDIEAGKEIDKKIMSRIGMNAATSILGIKSEEDAKESIKKLDEIVKRMQKLNTESSQALAKIAETISQSLTKLFSVFRPGSGVGAGTSLG
ncbi:MAG: hypothetical protein ACPW60_10180 [Methylohalobius sp. ZOD2]